MIQLTGVASRYVGYYIAAFLVLLGLFPAVGLVFSLMPEPVLGGATLLMFGTVAAAGIRIMHAGNQPEGYPCHGCQFLARPQCGAGSPKYCANCRKRCGTSSHPAHNGRGVTAILANLLIHIKE